MIEIATFITMHAHELVGGLSLILAISETLPATKKVKANGVISAAINLLKIIGKKKKK